MTRLLILWMSVALVLVAVFHPAEASEQTGTIRGTVTDGDKKPLGEVKILARSSELLGARVAETQVGGVYWLPALPPGLYDVQFEKQGFRTRLVRGIRVSVGRTASVDVKMDLASTEESVEVVESRPTLDTGQTDTGTTVTKEFLKRVPSGRSYQSTTRFAPGVVGGSNPNVQGGASNENSWLLDGVNITDPVTGTFSVNFPFDAIEEVEIKTGSFAPEYGEALGGIVNVRTESGSNEFEFRSSIYYSNGNLSPKRDGVYDIYGAVVEPSEFDRQSQAITLSTMAGGPIVKDKVWFFGAYDFISNQSTTLGVEAPRRFRGHLLFAKISMAPLAAHRLEFSGFINPTTIDNIVQSAYSPAETEAQQVQGGAVVRAQWEWFVGENVLWKAVYSFQKEYIDVTPMPCTWNSALPDKECQEGQPEGYIDYFTPARVGVDPAYDEDNYRRWSFDDRMAHSADLSLSWFIADALGPHEVKAGAQLRWTEHERIYGFNGNSYWVDILEDSSDPTSRTNYYWYEFPGQVYSRATGATVAAYLQDTWRPHPSLAINYGLRYERLLLRNDVGESIVDSHIVLPRVGMAWDPFHNKRTSLTASFGMFGSGGRLSISEFVNKNGLGYKLYLGDYFDHTTNYSYEQYYNIPTQSNYDTTGNLTTPRSYEVTLGVKQIVWQQLMVALQVTGKWYRYLWEDDEVNLALNEDGSGIVGSQDGVYNDYFRLRTPLQGMRDYYGFTLIFRQNLHRNFLVDGSVTYSITQGRTEDALTAALDNPVQYPYEYGYLSSDRPLVVKVAAAYEFPLEFNLGARFSYSSGSRYDRTYYSGKLGSYGLYRSEVGTYDSLSAYAVLDLKLTKGFALPQKKGRIELSVEATNVFNNRQATGINTSSLNAEGAVDATSRLSPFSMEFGLRYAL